MQNVVHNSKCDSLRESDLNEVGRDHSGSSSPLSANISAERRPSLGTNFMAELSESDDDDVSEVESFILEQGEFDEEPSLETAKFLLADEQDGTFDDDTQRRIEALFSASNNFFENGQLDTSTGNAYLDAENFKLTVDTECLRNRDLIEDVYSSKEVLKTLASAVNRSLDDATAVLNRMGSCSLVEACSSGDVVTVRKLLEEGRDVNEVTEEGESLLSLACSSGYYELAQLLLAMKASVEDRGLKDMTPLMEAANAGHLDIVKLLIQHGADVNAQTSQEKKLKGAKVKNQEMSLSKSSQQDPIHGTIPSIVCPEGNTPLMFACAAGHEDIVRVLLDAGARVEEHNENGHTPLMEAASAGHVGVAKLLVERGASINTHSNEFKESALTLACYKGHLEMVRFLLEAGADREHKTDEMHTALMEASMDGHVEVARLLLDSGAQVNMPADSFESPLTLAACGGHVELAMLLLDRGANIEEVNDEGYTPLMEAAREGHEEMVALLLSQGADINAQTEETQETALTLACCGGFLEVADFLIKAGADIELGASTPLMEAAQEGHLELVRYLIAAGANVNATTATGDTALTYACENGHTDVADLLLQAFAKLEHESEGGRTPLMKAARAGHLCTVQFLISKGANVNKQTTNNDHNPLSLACAGGHLPIVELLLAHGADPTHKLKDNSTMLIEAAKGGHTAVVQLLLDYPNSLLNSPPPPPDMAQMPNSSVENIEAPRVPPHGLPLFIPQESDPQNPVSGSSYLGNVQTVPRIQDILRETMPTSGPQAVPKQKTMQRKSALVKNNEAPSSSFCDSAQRYYRSKTNAAAQANSMTIQNETGTTQNTEQHLPAFVGGGGGNIIETDDKSLKPSERLEACINSMMKKAEMLHPSPEEQILQKQQILEELQRVERELQEKAHAQLLLTAQHQQQHHHQGIQIGTIVTGTPTISTVTNNGGNNTNSLSNLATVAGVHAQQLIFNTDAVLDIESLSSLTDISSVSNHMGLNLHLTTSANNLAFPPAVHSPQQLYNLSQQQLQQQSPQQQVQKVVQQSVITTTTPAADYCKSRMGKLAKQAKTVMKQNSQQPFQIQPPTLLQHPNDSIKLDPSQTIPISIEDSEKIVRSVVFNEQQQQHPQTLLQQQQQQQTQQHHQQQIQLQQQLLHQHSQQQFVLSEFTQNLTLRNTKYCEGAIAGVLHAMGGIKLTESTQTHTIPMYDAVTVGNALKQQQPHLIQPQQLQIIPQEQQQNQPPAPQQLPPQPLPLQTLPPQPQHFEKNVKLVKGKTNKVQQQSLLHTNPTPLTSMQQSQQQAIKQQLSSCNETCTTLVGSIPLDGTSVLTLSGMASPAFPVSIAVTPVSIPTTVSISTNCGAFTRNLALDEGLMVAAPARTLHETLGEIMTAPTTQLAGNQMNLIQQGAHCNDTCMAASGGKTRSLSMSSLPVVSASTSVPLAFCNFAPSSITPCVPLQVSASSECIAHHIPHLSHTAATAAAAAAQPSTPAPPLYPPLDLNSQTDSNHDTALTLACAGGHEELVSLLLSRGADIEHRDKKGFTPLMLAATAGHAGVVEILLNHAADVEAQSERTKDTALSLACSGGRYEVVDILLARGANKEHRNVSDYTPLSLAASGGYVNIIKLLLSHGAEINSRTGSKLGISPLMLAAMNGHTQAVRLLLDMGSDINAQIETNRNTALTLACFQGRHEVVNLLLERKANVEHRAKTGLTPLMEAASGGYVEVGKVLIDKGADVNAPPVPSSRDTALTIAADKGHYRFVQLLLERDAIVDVKNKKGNSPLWLAANGGHLEVVQLLCANNADIDSQDNRKVSCLMAAFRRGHVKVVKWMVKHVSQFPSDQEMARYMSTITDKGEEEHGIPIKELLKKCSQCVDTIRIAKERQAAEANKNANNLLEELESERSREENRKAAAARRRERKRRKKKEKQEQLRAAKAASEQTKKSEKSGDSAQESPKLCNHQQSDEDEPEDEDEEDEEEEEDDEDEEREEDDPLPGETVGEYCARIAMLGQSPSKSNNKPPPAHNSPVMSEKSKETASSDPAPCAVDKRRERDQKIKTQEKNKRNVAALKTATPLADATRPPEGEIVITEISKQAPKSPECNRINNKKRNSSSNNNNNLKQETIVNRILVSTSPVASVKSVTESDKCPQPSVVHNKHYAKQKMNDLVNGISNSSALADYNEICALFSQNVSMKGKKSSIDKLGLDTFGELNLDLPTEVALSAGLRSPSAPQSLQHSLKTSPLGSASPKKWQKRDEGWKEVVRSKLFNRSKKVSVPSNAISRVIGRGGMNINAIRESSGAHIEVEKQKGQGDRTVIIRGSAESTRVAQQLITALIKEPEKEISELFLRCGVNRVNNNNTASLNSTSSSVMPEAFKTAGITISNPSLANSPQVCLSSSQNKPLTKQHVVTKSSGNSTTSVTKTTSIPPPSLPANATPPFSNQFRSVVTQNIRPCIPVSSTATPPFLNSAQNAWTGVVASGKVPANVPRPTVPICTVSTALSVSSRVVSSSTVEKAPVNRQLFPPEKKNSLPPCTTSTKSTVSYTMAVIAQGGKNSKSIPASSAVGTASTKTTATSDTKVSTIAPISMERAGSAPPSSAVVHNQISLSACSMPSAVQPFATKISNSSTISQQNNQSMSISRIHIQPVPSQSKPFMNSSNLPTTNSSSSNSPSASPSGSSNVTSIPTSNLPQEYTPFNNNLFAKVAQSVWGPKDKEISKPNFASVAASGVTSVASSVQNSNPVQSSLTLTLPVNSESDLVIDASKAPGYRGNLHISPSASSISPATMSNAPQISVSCNTNFGPIGSGPRSAPCTPPLGPIGPPSSAASNNRRSTPPAVPSPPPPGLISRSLPESQTLNQINETTSRSMSGGCLHPQQVSEAMFHQSLDMPFHPSRLQSYPMAASPGGTNTTFSQHSPLSSVGAILLEGGNNGPMQVVQSNLNPNAPDFSSRNSLLMTSAGPSLHHLPRMPSGVGNFQETALPPHLQQFRPIFSSGAGGLNHNFSIQHAMAASAQTQAAMNRFSFHHMPHAGPQPQQQTEFNVGGSAGNTMGLPQGAESLPLLNMVAGYPHPSAMVPGSGPSIPHYPGLQSMMGIRPNQRSASTTPSVGTSSKDDESPVATMSPNVSPQGSNLPSPTGGGMGLQENPNPAGTIGEDRKLPRPIGMERAQQRKNPVFGGVSEGIWSYSSSGRSDVPASGAEWLHSMQNAVQPMQQQEEAQMPPSMHHGYPGHNRFPDVLQQPNMENSHPLDQYNQQQVGSYSFVNGLPPPPHVVAPHLYGPNNVDAQPAEHMWGAVHHSNKTAAEPSQNMEQKMTWQSWSPHQA